MKKITFLTFLLVSYFSYGQELASYSYTNGSGTPSAGFITAGGISSRGITTGASPLGFFSVNWETSNALNSRKYFEWSITPDPGYEIDLSSMNISYFTSEFFPFFLGNAPTDVEIYIDLGNGSGEIKVYDSNPTLGANNNETIDLSGYNNISNTIVFKLYAFGATAGIIENYGSVTLSEFTAASGKSIIINGIVNPIPCSGSIVTTWDGVNWDNGAPTVNDIAVINGTYNTGTNGNISSCSLTVNPGNVLTVTNGSFIEIENDITVDGSIIVNAKGSVVQNDDNAIVTNNGLIEVFKETAFLNKWYEYTYWSSPVSGETIGGGLFEGQPDRRFSFNAQNFLDATMEVGNDNSTAPGQDDIDDNGDDWQFAAASDVMTPGVGYASTHSQAFFLFPSNYQYVFNGAFNNGVITVPIYRNDSETNDINWNLVGNPYPSAIDVDLFLAANTNVATDINHSGDTDGAIFLWSQNTEPSGNNNGNEQLNFDVSDYAVINAIGETAGGDGLTPSRFIPSGQGFFISFSDSATPDSTVGDISEGTVTFNNSMRVTANNDEFFRTSGKNKKSSSDKLWINLTSDNGVFNQVMIGYATGATNTFDGIGYDAPKNLSTTAPSILYSIIEGNDKKFAIQGRDPLTLDENEVLKIGFKTTIDISTIYTLSIPQLEGDFLNNNPIVLKDNLLDTSHDLKNGDYNFTSEVGEFNDRFEIVFSSASLSNDDLLASEKKLSIVEQSNGDVQFKLASNSLQMKNIQIIDLRGRTIYNFDVNKNDSIHQLSALSQSPYIAKVTLNNNQTITKKAIKKY